MKFRIAFLSVMLLLPSVAGAQQFLARMAVAEDPDFQKRVEFAIVKKAIAVQTEDTTTCCYPVGVTHATATDAQKVAAARLARQRSTFASMTLRNPRDVVRNVAIGVVTNLALTTQSTDVELEATVASMWTAFSKVNTP